MKLSITVFLTAITLGGGSAWAAEGVFELNPGTALPAQVGHSIMLLAYGGGHGGGGGGGGNKGTAAQQSASGSGQGAVAQDSKPAGVTDMASLSAMVTQWHKGRSERYKPALDQLRANPAAADVADCQGMPQNARDVCIRNDIKVSLKPDTAGIPATHRRIALLFGNNAYNSDPNVPPLVTPISDVKAVAEQLRRLNYEVRVVTNATKADFVNAMNQLAGDTERADSILIMYAGHGYLMDAIHMGFWIPVDGKSTSPDRWISNKDISRFLSILPARQVILVSDSCFSGTLTKEQKIKEKNKLKRADIFRQRSVLALSSGGDEPVSDEGSTAGHSVFAGHLLKSFDRLQDDITGFELYRGLYNAVLQEFPQHPQYGAVLTAGHTGQGDYLIDVKAK